MMRVAAVQLTTSANSSENLTSCLRLIDLAVAGKAEMVVLPVISDRPDQPGEQDWNTALSRDDARFAALAERALQHRCYIVTAATLRRQYPYVADTSLMFGPDGSCLLEADAHMTGDHDKATYASPRQPPQLLDIDQAKIGLLPGADGFSFECARVLALQDAQLLCHSAGLSQKPASNLHFPVRAAENRVFMIVAASQQPQCEAQTTVEGVAKSSLDNHLAEVFVSQILAPDGRQLARARGIQEEVIWADIEPSEANGKIRPDGSDLFFNRRPSLYGDMLQPPPSEQQLLPARSSTLIQAINIALIGIDGKDNAQRLDQALVKLSKLPSSIQLAVLPELFWLASVHLYPLSDIHEYARQVQIALLQVCRQRQMYICTSLILNTDQGWQHCGVLLGPQGVEIHQPQLHFTARFGWHQAGEELVTADLPWGRVAIFTGDDGCYPELVKVAALRGVQTLLLPFNCQEDWESRLGLLSRVLENRISVIACSRDMECGNGLIATADSDWMLMAPESRLVLPGQQVSITRHTGGTLVARLERPADHLTRDATDMDVKLQSCWFLATELCKPEPSRIDAFEGWGSRLM